MLARLRQVVLVGRGQLIRASDVRASIQQLDRLTLDRVCVAQVPGLQPPSDQALVPLGLTLMGRKRRGDLSVTGDLRGQTHLHERLFLDRMHIGQVLGQLLLERAGDHRTRPFTLSHI